jgi:hypothetical protein
MHIEFEDGSGDPSGYSYAVRRDISLCDDDEELQQWHESERKINRTNTTVCEDDEVGDEVNVKALNDDILAEVEVRGEDGYIMDPQERRFRRARLCGIICCSCLCCIFLLLGLGDGVFFVSKNVCAKKAVHSTPCSTFSPTLTQPPSLANM